nr:hypothetical protein CFP56_24067 [Quercus suber]
MLQRVDESRVDMELCSNDDEGWTKRTMSPIMVMQQAWCFLSSVASEETSAHTYHVTWLENAAKTPPNAMHSPGSIYVISKEGIPAALNSQTPCPAPSVGRSM